MQDQLSYLAITLIDRSFRESFSNIPKHTKKENNNMRDKLSLMFKLLTASVWLLIGVTSLPQRAGAQTGGTCPTNCISCQPGKCLVCAILTNGTQCLTQDRE